MLRNEAGTRLRADPEPLHDMRVAMRRMRAALRIFRHALPAARLRWLMTHLRWIGGVLGAVRDLDVYLLHLREDVDAAPRELWPGVDIYHQRLQNRREKARSAMLRALDSKRFARFAAALQRFLDKGPPRRPSAPRATWRVGPPAGHILAKRLEKVLEDGRRIGEHSTDAELHRLRIDCKRLRYACEFFDSLLGNAGTQFAGRIKTLQDALGAHQDAVVGLRILREESALMARSHSARPALEHLVEGHARWTQTTRKDVFRAWKNFDRKPARAPFVRRLDTIAGSD